MIWQSPLLMGLIDAAIVVAALAVMVVFFRHRGAIRLLGLEANVAWVVLGLLALALLYASDLVTMSVLPGLTSPEVAMAVMTELHLHWSWFASLIAVASIAFGLLGLLGRLLPETGRMMTRLQADLDARDQAEEALRESEARYRELFEGSPISIWDEDWSGVKALVDGLRDAGVEDFAEYFETHPEFVARAAAAIRFVDVNRITLEYFRSSDEGFESRDKEAFLAEMADRCRKAPFEGFAERLAALAGGAVRMTNENWSPLEKKYIRTTVEVPDTRRVTWSRVLVTAEDITERKQAEAALRESEALLRLIADNLPATISYIDKDRRVQFVNEQFTKWYGMPLDDVRGRHLWDTMDDERYAYLGPYFDAAFSGETVRFEHDSTTHDGKLFDVDAIYAPAIGEDGEVTGIVALTYDISQCKQAEAALRESEERFRQLAENIREVLWVRDLAFDWVVYISPRVIDIWGVSAEAMIANPERFFDGIHPDDRDRIAEAAKRHHERDYDEEYRVIRPDGSQRWVHDRGFPVRDAKGRIYRFVGLAEDITARKEAALALREAHDELERRVEERTADLSAANARLQRAQEIGSIAVYEWDLVAHEIIYRSDVLYCIYGTAPEETPGNFDGLMEMLHPDDRERVAREYAAPRGRDTVFKCEYRIVRPDGEIRHVDERSSPVFDEDGVMVRSVGTTQDITERKLAEVALRDSETRLTRAQELARIGTFEWDVEKNTVIHRSDVMYNIYGVPPDQMPDDFDGVMQIFHPDDRAHVAAAYEKSISIGERYEEEYRVVRPDGEIRYVNAIGSPLFDAAGTLARYLGTVQDITERKLAEEALREGAARLREAQRIAGLGHWEWDLVEDQLYFFGEVRQIFGVAPEDFVVTYDEYRKGIHPGDLAFVDREMVRLRTAGTAYDIEYRFVRADGEIRTVHELGEGVRDGSGKLVRAVGTMLDITERKRAEDALRESERSLINAQHLAYVGHWEWQFEHNKYTWSDEMYRIVGLSRDTFDHTVEQFYEVVHPDDLEMLRCAGRKAREGLTDYQIEFRIVRPDGGLRHVSEFAEAAIDPASGSIRMRGVLQDITERKLIEEALRESNARLTRAQEIAHIGNYEWDIVRGEFIHLSDVICDIYGRPREQLLTDLANLLAFIHPDDREAVATAYEKTKSSGEVFNAEFRIIRPDGEVRYVNDLSIPIRDEKGVWVRNVGTIQDITERTLIEQNLRDSEALFRAFVDTIPVEIIIRDTEGRFLFVNREWENLTGRTNEQMIGKMIDEVYAEDAADLYKTQDRLALESGQVVDQEVTVPVIPGLEVTSGPLALHTIKFPIRDAHGEITRIGSTAIDITERKRIEEALRDNEARLARAASLAKIGLWDWDVIEDKATYCSQELADMYGVASGPELAALLSSHSADMSMVHPDDVKFFDEAVRVSRAANRGYDLEYRIINRAGETRHVHGIEELVENERGEIVRSFGVSHDITEQKRAEEALRESEARYEQAADIAKLGHWAYDEVEDRIAYVSPELARIHGMTTDEYRALVTSTENDINRAHPDDRAHFGSVLRAAQRDGKPFDVTYRVLRPDGEVRHVRELGEPILGEAGRLIRSVGTIQDITEQKRVEEALRESEALFRAFVDTIPVEVIIRDAEGRFLFANPAWENMAGRTSEQMIGKTFHEVYAKEAADLYMAQQRTVLETGQVVDQEVVASSIPGRNVIPNTLALHIIRFPISDTHGDITRVGSISFDITERKRMEEALRESEGLFRAFVDTIPADIVIRDLGNHFLFVNRAWENNMGRTSEQTIGKAAHAVYAKEEADLNKIQIRTVLETGQAVDQEVEVPSAPGQMEISDSLAFHMIKFPIRDTHGDITRIGSISIDITERKRAEAEIRRLNEDLEQRVDERTAELREVHATLIRQERLATLGQLTATVSHELRNPLGAMRNAIAVIKRLAGDEPPLLLDSADIADRSISRCDDIITDLLDYTRTRPLNLEPAPIDGWLGEVLDEYELPEGIRLGRALAAGAEIAFDHERLRRTLINLMDNACQAMKGDGALAKASGDGAGVLSVATRIEDDRLELIVGDTGPGVPPGERAQIFEPLYSTKNFGVGLGLPIVRQIIELHGGEIEIAGEAGEGARFILQLPLDAPEQKAAS